MDEARPISAQVSAAGLRSARQPAVPDYELLRRIGGGAYGEVWLARNQATHVLRAAKIVWRHTFEDERPFRREFEGIQKFERISREHPRQLALFHIGRNEAEGYFYYVMEVADDFGEQKAKNRKQKPEAEDPRKDPNSKSATEVYVPHTLRADLGQGRLAAARVLEVGLALAEALSHLHRNGLVHRDVKPSNVIFVKGRPKLADIGLVTDASDQCSIVGTEGYLPPEGPGTPQADIFALGKVLYEAATGMDRRKFPDLPVDLRQWPERDALLELNPIMLKACAGDIRNRYASAEEMLSDLALLQRGKSVRRHFRRRRLFAAGRKLGLVTVVVGAMAAGLFALWSRLASPYDVSSREEVREMVEKGFQCANAGAPERQQEAERYFKDALELDPSFVPAHWGLFQVAINNGEWQWNAPAQDQQHIHALAEHLMQIAPDRAESHVAASFIKWMDWKFADSLEEDRAAIRARAASKEGRGTAHNVYGWHLLQTGHPDEAQAEYLKAKPLEPTSPIVLHHLGHPYFARRQFAEALRYYQESVRLEPRHIRGHIWVARLYEETGNFLGAIQEFEEVSRLRGKEQQTRAFYDALREAVRQDQDPAHGYWAKRLELALKPSPRDQDSYGIATLYARLGDTTNAYSYMQKACEKHAFSEGPLFDLCWNHSDTNFQAIVRGIGLLQ